MEKHGGVKWSLVYHHVYLNKQNQKKMGESCKVKYLWMENSGRFNCEEDFIMNMSQI